MAASLSTGSELLAQWKNPGDIFSLLLLVGADIVQQAIAQLVGVPCALPWNVAHVYLTPVPFSFGWIAYAFTSLAAVWGDKRLMPAPDIDIQVINCKTGFARQNNSWILGRLVRAYESRVNELESMENLSKDSMNSISLLIELFEAQPIGINGPRPSKTWWSSWVIIILQQAVAAIPWVLWGFWSPFVITAGGTLLAIATGAMPQWADEKWSAARVTGDKEKFIALTRGNGHRYVMIIRSQDGTWDLETMASGRLKSRPSTKYAVLVLTCLWTVLLLTVTGMKQHSWFVIGVGGFGSLWQIYIAMKTCPAADLDIGLQPWEKRDKITGYQYTSTRKKEMKEIWKSYTQTDAVNEFHNEREEPNVEEVMGALSELEKLIGKAGASLMSIFFPAGLDYDSISLSNERNKYFWAYAKTKRSEPRKP